MIMITALVKCNAEIKEHYKQLEKVNTGLNLRLCSLAEKEHFDELTINKQEVTQLLKHEVFKLLSSEPKGKQIELVALLKDADGVPSKEFNKFQKKLKKRKKLDAHLDDY